MPLTLARRLSGELIIQAAAARRYGPRLRRWAAAIEAGHRWQIASEMRADAAGDWPGVEAWRDLLEDWATWLEDLEQAELHAAAVGP